MHLQLRSAGWPAACEPAGYSTLAVPLGARRSAFRAAACPTPNEIYVGLYQGMAVNLARCGACHAEPIE